MEIRQLTYFLAAAQTQNFRQAAELSLVTQPALSRQIAALEKELGIELFKREKQHVQLTSAGRAFVVHAKNALEMLQQGEQEMVRWQQGESGSVLIGCNATLSAVFLPPLLASFRKQYPAIHLSVCVQHSAEIITLVERGEVDLGFIYHPTVRSDSVVIKELFRQPLSLLTPFDHPLTRLPSHERTLQCIINEPLILLGKGAQLRQVLERLFLQRGLSVQPIIEIDSIEGLKELVKQGCGVTLVPPPLLWASSTSERLALLPIADVTEMFVFALVYRRIGPLTVPARQFINATIATTSTVIGTFSPARDEL